MRADRLLLELGLARSRTEAASLIKAGRMFADGRVVGKPSVPLRPDAGVTLERDWTPASRAALKLRAAIATLRREGHRLDFTGARCLDIGASTGGFTALLLEEGASQVIALDVGHGQLRPELRADHRVVVMEGVNARHLTPDQLPYRPSWITCDTSFISLALLFPAIVEVAAPGAHVLLLAKPQFEVGRGQLGRGGVVKSEHLAREAVTRLEQAAAAAGVQVQRVLPSAVTGANGNQEFFLFGQLTGKVAA